MKIFSYVRLYKWYILSVLAFAGVAYYFFGGTSDTTDAGASFYIVNTVERGAVSSGIETTGQIVAAQKLDLDVYKQLSRIDVVNVANGSHVEAGDVLVSFDKSDASVSAESSRVAVAEAELALNTERANATDPSTEIRSLEDKIAGYKKSITDAEQDIKDAYRDFLNEDLEVVPSTSDYDRLSDETAPTIGGRYVSDIEGEYTIDVYGSGSESGFSFRLSGLETGTYSVIFGKAVDLGTRGLEITFPSTVRTSDTWVVKVPNTGIATYVETKRVYEEMVATLNKNIAGYNVSLANAEQELANLRLTDTSDYRNLSVEKAALTLSEARERLSQNYDVLQERDIVAPFAGTIQDMENVVEGATPTGGTSDTINLGTLISDTFLTTFTLSATDVAKVTVGQKVKVTVTSFREQPVLEGTISEISSLPASTGVAQYEVRAELAYDRTKSDLILREGMLADIQVVEKENSDALRIPTSAVTYVEGKPTVQVVTTLTPEQEKEVARLGIIRTLGQTLETYSATLKLGIQGQFYVEVLEGLKEGDRILTTAVAETSGTGVVEEAGFGPGRRQSTESGSTESTNAPHP